MKYEEIEKLLSQPRLNRYLVACGNSKVKAKKLYSANLRVSQAFYPVFHLFEIIFRNKIDDRLSSYFSNPNWIITEKNGFMNDPSLRYSNYFLKNQVAKAERKLRQRRRSVTTGKVIAEQSLGFWVSLFDRHHYRLISGYIINCFPHKPTSVNRHIISVKLQRIRDFRNRIYHNEPICFDATNIDFQHAEDVKTDIYDLLLWIDTNAKAYVEAFDNIDGKIRVGKRI